MNLYYLLLDNADWGKREMRLLQEISAQRREKVMSYRFLADRKLSLYSALLVRMELSLLTGIPAGELQFYNHFNHKPALLTAPQVFFNLSHTQNMILCGISLKEAVGVDVEKINTAPLDVMEHVFHTYEIRYVQCASSNLKDIRFYEIWTKKEAYTKQLGIGLGDNPTKINTLELPSYFYTWKHGEYMCSCYEEGLDLHRIYCVSAKDIWQHFHVEG